jgi:hypothetical protein
MSRARALRAGLGAVSGAVRGVRGRFGSSAGRPSTAAPGSGRWVDPNDPEAVAASMRSLRAPASGAAAGVSGAPAAAAKQRGLVRRTILGPADASLWRKGGGLGVAGVGGLSLATTMGLVSKRGDDAEIPVADLSGLDLRTASFPDMRLQRLQQAYGSADDQIVAQQEALNQMLGQSAAADQNYRQLMENYRANTMRDIDASYGRASNEALRAAREIESGGLMARDAITGEGAATAAALQALAEEPARAGSGMFTGLVPVTGDVADAPQAALNAANITAEAAQRGVNITRDDLRAAAAMAPMVSEAYGRQVDSEVAMAIALAQIAGDKERAQAQFEGTSRLAQQRSDLALSRAAQEDAVIAEALSLIDPENFQQLVDNYQRLAQTPEGQSYLASRGIDSFSRYVESIVGPDTLRLLREFGGGIEGS